MCGVSIQGFDCKTMLTHFRGSLNEPQLSGEAHAEGLHLVSIVDLSLKQSSNTSRIVEMRLFTDAVDSGRILAAQKMTIVHFLV